MNELRKWLTERGYIFEPILDDKWHRFDRAGDKNGYFIGRNNVFSNVNSIIIATVGDWKTGEKDTFKSYEGESKSEKRVIAKMLRIQQIEVERCRKESQQRAAKEAKLYFKQGNEEGTTQYLERKMITIPPGCRIVNDAVPILVVPMTDVDDNFIGVQKIFPDGKKFFYKDQRTKGGFYVIGSLTAAKEVFVCEGVATGMSIYMAAKKPVIVAFNAGNLPATCEVISKKHPDLKITIAADEDLWTKKPDGSPYNPGREKAEEAAKAVGAGTVFPVFKDIKKGLSDFNDVHVLEGLDVVKMQLSDINPVGEVVKRQIIVSGKQMSAVIDELWKEIHRNNRPEPKLFYYGGGILRLEKQADGTFYKKMMGVDDIYGHILRCVDWMSRKNGEEPAPTKPQKDIIAKDLLSSPNTNLPPLETIIQIPVLNRHGVLIRTPGYHRSDAIFADPNGLFDLPEIAEIPSKDEIESALDLIKFELIGDFPFADHYGATHALAAIILPFVRRMILGPTPLHSIEATLPGSGKGLLADIISLVFTGKPAEVCSLSASDDEIKKEITAELLRDKTLILIDNVAAKNRIHQIDSQSLAAVLTAENWTARILGISKMASFPNLSMWMMTANNPQFSPELYRRRIPIRLSPAEANPEQRTGFRHPNLKLWTKENRKQLIHAVLVLIQAWISNGCPRSDKVLGSYEDWTSIIGGILEVARVEGFLGHLKNKVAQSDETLELLKLLVHWWNEYREKPVLPSDIDQLCEKHNLLNYIRGTENEKSRVTKLGLALGDFDGCTFGNFTIELAENRGNHGKRYRLLPSEKNELKNGFNQGPQSKKSSDSAGCSFSGNVGNLEPYSCIKKEIIFSDNEKDQKVPVVPKGGINHEPRV